MTYKKIHLGVFIAILLLLQLIYLIYIVCAAGYNVEHNI